MVVHVLSGDATYYLIPGVEYSVGRKPQSDIHLKADTKHGVSRKQGVIECRTNGDVVYTDMSQFGTVVNSTKVKAGECVTLVAGECTMRFGNYEVVFVLELMRVAVSNLPGALKQEVVSSCNLLNVVVSNTWDASCTTLVMNSISVTMKVISAVSERRCILTPSFLTHLLTASHNKHKPSPPAEYLSPAANDPSISTVNFLPDYARKSLFDNLNFVFSAERELEENKRVIVSGGGNTYLLDALQPGRKAVVLDQNSVVMDTKDKALSSYLRKTLLEAGKAPTKTTDIALALFHVDKNRVRRFAANTQHSQLLNVECTQALSDTQHTANQSTVCRSRDTARNVSVFEPSVVPPRLDKTIATPNTKCGPKRDLIVTPKAENVSMFEPSAIPPRLDKTIATPNQKVGSEKDKIPSVTPKSEDVSMFEPSVVPPRLDKTITTPRLANQSTVCRSRDTPNTKQPPRLSTTSTKNENISIFEPSAIPPRLDKTIATPNTKLEFEEWEKPSVSPKTGHTAPLNLDNTATTPRPSLAHSSVLEPSANHSTVHRSRDLLSTTPRASLAHGSVLEQSAFPPSLGKTITTPARRPGSKGGSPKSDNVSVFEASAFLPPTFNTSVATASGATYQGTHQRAGNNTALSSSSAQSRDLFSSAGRATAHRTTEHSVSHRTTEHSVSKRYLSSDSDGESDSNPFDNNAPAFSFQSFSTNTSKRFKSNELSESVDSELNSSNKENKGRSNSDETARDLFLKDTENSTVSSNGNTHCNHGNGTENSTTSTKRPAPDVCRRSAKKQRSAGTGEETAGIDADGTADTSRVGTDTVDTGRVCTSRVGTDTAGTSRAGTSRAEVNGGASTSTTICGAGCWLAAPAKREHQGEVLMEGETETEPPLCTLVFAELKVSDVSRASAGYVTGYTGHVTACGNVRNFKRFKKNTRAVRSIEVTLSETDYRANSGGSSLLQDTQELAEDDEDEESQLFFA